MTQPRSRPKHRFRFEGPVKVDKTELAEARGFIARLGTCSRWRKTRAIGAFNEIAIRTRTSRSIQAQSASRPDVAATLTSLGTMAGELISLLDGLSGDDRQKIHDRFQFDLRAALARGLDHWFVAECAATLSDACRLANDIPKQLSLKYGTSFASRPALEQVHSVAVRLATRLESLPLNADGALIAVSISRPEWDDGADPIASAGSQLNWLIDAAAEAAHELKRLRGPRGDGITFRTVKELVAVHKYVTGRLPTYSNGRRGFYRGEALSDVGKWVVECMKVIDPHHQRGVRDALEHVIWSSRSGTSATDPQAVSAS